MLLHLQQYLRGKVVKVECDNSSAVTYINKQGGTRSWTLCQEAMTLYEWAFNHQVMLQAVHRPGVNNELADYLSRNRPDPTEWSLSKRACRMLFQRWGTPQVDLFASSSNHKLPVWFSRTYHPEATAVDAFHQNWSGLFVYAHPPFKLIRKTLLQIRNQQVEKAIVVLPNWPSQDWYPLLLELALEGPVLFKLEIDLLSQKLQDRGIQYHPNLNWLHLSAWKLSGYNGRKQVSPSTL